MSNLVESVIPGQRSAADRSIRRGSPFIFSTLRGGGRRWEAETGAAYVDTPRGCQAKAVRDSSQVKVNLLRIGARKSSDSNLPGWLAL